MDQEEMLELMEMTRDIMDLLGTVMGPEGFNVGLNFGRCGGAGCPGHLHLHIVPRWGGDTNFMPVLSDTKIIHQALEDLYDRLTAELDKAG
jgi:ATP adenylyltransferase